MTQVARPAKGRPDRITYGWRVPMWDPGGAKLQTWLPHVHEHLQALRGSIYESVWMSDHLVPGASWAPPEWDTLECITALIHFASLYPDYRYGQIVQASTEAVLTWLRGDGSTPKVLLDLYGQPHGPLGPQLHLVGSLLDTERPAPAEPPRLWWWVVKTANYRRSLKLTRPAAAERLNCPA